MTLTCRHPRLIETPSLGCLKAIARATGWGARRWVTCGVFAQAPSTRKASRTQSRLGASGSPRAAITSNLQGEFAYTGLSRQEHVRGVHQLSLLGCIDRCQATAKRLACAVAHFNEDHHVAIPHHQVELAAARPRVSRQQLQAMRLQVGEGGGFDRSAAGAAIGSSGQRAPSAIGTATPPVKRDQVGRRSTLPNPSRLRRPVAPAMSLFGDSARRSR